MNKPQIVALVYALAANACANLAPCYGDTVMRLIVQTIGFGLMLASVMTILVSP